jgi:hypothetical protein
MARGAAQPRFISAATRIFSIVTPGPDPESQQPSHFLIVCGFYKTHQRLRIKPGVTLVFFGSSLHKLRSAKTLHELTTEFCGLISGQTHAKIFKS